MRFQTVVRTPASRKAPARARPIGPRPSTVTAGCRAEAEADVEVEVEVEVEVDVDVDMKNSTPVETWVVRERAGRRGTGR
ncbi:hypothetical protein GCM10017750_29860 [Streptomyces racemochromogenes]